MLNSTRRVVITGMGGISPVGSDWVEIEANLRACRSGVRYMDEWDEYSGLNTRLGAPVADFELPAHYDRKTRRSMGRVS